MLAHTHTREGTGSMTYPQDPYQSREGVPYGEYGPQQPYPYGPAYGYPPPTSTNGMAIGSLVTSIFGFLCYGIPGAVGAVLGHVALRQIARSGQQGRGLALAGVIVGWLSFGLWAALLVVLIVLGTTGQLE